MAAEARRLISLSGENTNNIPEGEMVSERLTGKDGCGYGRECKEAEIHRLSRCSASQRHEQDIISRTN